MSYVDPQAVADYARDGAVVIRGCFTPEQVELVREGVARNLAEPGPLVAVASESSDTGRFVEDFCNWQRIPEFEQAIRGSGVAEVAAGVDDENSRHPQSNHVPTNPNADPCPTTNRPAAFCCRSQGNHGNGQVPMASPPSERRPNSSAMRIV